ncbi:hypothetical protein [Treponema sp.]|uniref:hypothetical protein n=1 Tax=Treponema sp. TaxID=166 RepID=UPI003F086428
MAVLKILLIIIRIPCTVWYVLTGCFFSLLPIAGYYSSKHLPSTTIYSFLALEFASFTKFYNIREMDLDSMTKKLFKIAGMAGVTAGILECLYSIFAK